MTSSRRLLVALMINVAIVVVQVVAGVAANSIGLLADAGHNVADVAALMVGLLAVHLAGRAPTRTHSYGFHRATTLAAQANAASILVVTGILAVEAIRRLSDPGPVKGGLVAAVALLGLAGNAGAARLLGGHGDPHDLNIRAAMLHLAGDAAASAAVLVAGLVIALTGGWEWLDPAASLVVSALIVWQAVRLLRDTANVLLEAAPVGLDVSAVRQRLRDVPGVAGVHDLHVWSLSSNLSALSTHLVASGEPTLAEAQAISREAKEMLEHDFAIGHATIEMEWEACSPDGVDPCLAATEPAPTPHAHTHTHAH